MWNTQPEEIWEEHDHSQHSAEIPLRNDAFAMDDEEKMAEIQAAFAHILTVMGMDLNDDSLKDTPRRVAKMYVQEIFAGLNPKNKPVVRLFKNNYKYGEMILEKDITFFSMCEHHFMPFYGRVHVAYKSSGKVAGLSKLNRMVQYIASRPQVQERLTMQIGQELQKALNTQDVAVVVEANHMCVAARGVHDVNSSTVTFFYGGELQKDEAKAEFLQFIK